MTSDQFEGCLLGLALGDALGAPFEGGFLERLLWRFLGRTAAGHARWTDDTQMSKDTAESLVANGALDPDDLARRFAASYRWSRGYGPGTAKMLKRIARGADWRSANRSVYPQGSFGNGGAMRAPVVGLFYAERPQERVEPRASRRASPMRTRSASRAPFWSRRRRRWRSGRPIRAGCSMVRRLLASLSHSSPVRRSRGVGCEVTLRPRRPRWRVRSATASLRRNRA